MIRNPKLSIFYYVELVGISVRGRRIAGIKPSMFRLSPTGNGGVIVDSGTLVTRLVQPAYTFLRQTFREGASNLQLAGEFSLFDRGELDLSFLYFIGSVNGGESWIDK
ncbi:hypothetical protein MLD38_018230 [Melastoma candidum]|uniref:Uncharacterized protein n=1 Tax=Melastoma candidum TaxID=119954 RepID=A0ACB9QUH2_9MYRT|nr:hypothetical protein MLD38_018230 [Melastoma candidum]